MMRNWVQCLVRQNPDARTKMTSSNVANNNVVTFSLLRTFAMGEIGIGPAYRFSTSKETQFFKSLKKVRQMQMQGRKSRVWGS